MNEEQVERVRELLQQVPPGRVTTYGDLADAAGLSSPRLAGRILAEDSADLAWHRVVNAAGRPAPHKSEEQLQRLRAEGAPIRDGRVVLSAARWRFGD
ncbi:MGMT family protein [Rhodococcus sp. X156]|uniref:MGMT family protein n=1 Tax=Rhodococcus sp. X156 TaxID=2499145 RepID=UPI000FD9F8FF|nr:MGMT family protein [Rhodococcus sp. X156]